jgi:soluble lytic murein transglycosylase-like protein
MKRLLYLIVLMASTTSLWAGEYVVLGNGFRLHADRHEAAGDAIRIFSGNGVMEMPAASVASFEQDDQTNPIPVQPPVFSTTLPDIAVALTPLDLAGQAAKKYKLPDGFVEGVMKAESGFQLNAVSPKGAIGLMQLMPETARQLGVDPHDPHQNADGGAQYLRDLLAKYENDPNQVLLALAAYNAGPAAVDKYHGVPPYAETRQYILRVLKNWDRAENK